MPVGTNSRSGPVLVRPLSEADVPAFLGLIQALADYEKLEGPDAEARARLTRDALVDPPSFRVLLAARDGKALGYAVYFETYSTFLARPTLYLEDIFVLEEERGSEVGTALMRELAREAVRRDCGRMEWQVLTWNTPAMAFYQRFGASPLDDWRAFRLSAEQFALLAESD